jgi:hypothetical protein
MVAYVLIKWAPVEDAPGEMNMRGRVLSGHEIGRQEKCDSEKEPRFTEQVSTTNLKIAAEL